MAVVKNGTVRFFLFSFGCLALGLGIIGAFLPVLPTTPFVLLAAWCFLKSSPKMHQWIYRQPVMGNALRDWDQNRAISRKAKILSLSMMALSAAMIWYRIDILWLQISVSCILATVAVYIVTRNETSKPK